MERNNQDKQHKGQRMKALTFEKELDDFLERVLRQESVGRRRNRFLLCRLWQVDRRNKRRKSFGNLLLTKSLIWAKSFRVWESFERLSCTIESISARHCPPPSWVGNCFSFPGPGILSRRKALLHQLEEQSEWGLSLGFFCSHSGIRPSHHHHCAAWQDVSFNQQRRTRLWVKKKKILPCSGTPGNAFNHVRLCCILPIKTFLRTLFLASTFNLCGSPTNRDLTLLVGSGDPELDLFLGPSFPERCGQHSPGWRLYRVWSLSRRVSWIWVLWKARARIC